MPCGGPRKAPLQLHVAGLSRSARDRGDDCMPSSNLDRLCAPSRAGRGRDRGRQCVVHPWMAQSSSPATLAANVCQIIARARELRIRWCWGPDVRHLLPTQKRCASPCGRLLEGGTPSSASALSRRSLPSLAGHQDQRLYIIVLGSLRSSMRAGQRRPGYVEATLIHVLINSTA
jgi:hypothetical protein